MRGGGTGDGTGDRRWRCTGDEPEDIMEVMREQGVE